MRKNSHAYEYFIGVRIIPCQNTLERHLFMPFQIKALPIESIDILVEFGFVLDTMF